jgi:N-glycosylase/DNA lyase
LGLKEASHFLRDIGYSADLAIIDVHIVSFLRELALIEDRWKFSITARVYDRLESIMRSIALRLGVNLAIFDMAIWIYMRRREN